MIRSVGIVILLTGLVLSCKKDKTTVDLGYDYFPTKTGLTRVYQVTDIFHDIELSPAHDTNYYQIKEVIGEVYTDETGDEAYELLRYFRISESDPWQVKDVWTMKRTATTAEQVEENNRIIKMGFGINSNTTWDANALNNSDENQCRYSVLYKPFSLNTLTFDSTCTVLHQDFISFVDYQNQYHIYAKHIGCIYSVHKDLVIDNFDTLDISKGTELFYELLEYSD